MPKYTLLTWMLLKAMLRYTATLVLPFRTQPLTPLSFKILSSVVLQGKKLGKSVYVFSVDPEQGKVAHVNFVADDAKSRGVDGRLWANAVVEVVGGKVSTYPIYLQGMY